MATSYPKSLQGAMDQMMSDSDTSECPAPTQDITLNLKNRAKAITAAKYGPENPNLPNEAYWKRMADEWDVSSEDAKKSRCGNCAAFNVSDKIKQCIADGIGNEADPWGTIKLVLGWIIDTEHLTIRLPPHRIERLADILESIPRSQHRTSIKKWHQVLGELQSMALALPGSRNIFSTMQNALTVLSWGLGT